MAARSRSIFGPYEYCPCNPILTHRHLGRDYPVNCVGHADLVDDGRGNWYMVLLACRPEEGYTLMGRETFLAKVTWEDGWPVVNAGVGRLEERVTLPGAGSASGREPVCRAYSFDGDALPPELLTLRNHRERVLSLDAAEQGIRLFMRPDTLRDSGEAAYLALRQKHRRCEIETTLRPHFSQKSDCAGIALVQNERNQLRAECYQNGDGVQLRVISCADGADALLAQTEAPAPEEIGLRLRVEGLCASVLLKSGEGWRPVASGIDLRPLSTERSGGFVGCTMGLYASGNGADAGGYADFSGLIYRELL